jgi:hypothetical protein
MYFFVVLAARKNDAADLVMAVPTRCGYNFLAVFSTVQSLDFPDIRFNSRVLQLPNCVRHEPGTKLEIIRLPVSLEPVELSLFRWHQEFEHEQAAALAVQVFGQASQSC